MKRALKLASRLFPASWRRRYGAEYEAIVEDLAPRPGDVVDVIWTAAKIHFSSAVFRRVVLPSALLGVLAGFASSFCVPDNYVSETIFSGSARISQGVCGEAVDLPAGLRDPNPEVCNDKAALERFHDAVVRAFSPQFLESVILKHDLYPKERATGGLPAAATLMKADIFVKWSGFRADRFQFAVQFEYPQPWLAAVVDRELSLHLLEHRVGASIQLDPNTHFVCRLDRMPSMPSQPTGLSRAAWCLVGLLAGLLGSAVVLRIRTRSELAL